MEILFMKKFKIYILLFFLAVFFLTSCGSKETAKVAFNHDPKFTVQDLVVHYIDVGQGDSILIQINDKNILIDGGPTSNSNKLVKYLKSENANTFDYVIATHPHEDHIGGLTKVIKDFDIKQFWAPKVTDNTSYFNSMVNALRAKNLKINVTKAGTNLDLGENINCEMLAPNSSNYQDLNNYSVVLKITYGKTSFLFMGDAEKLSEQEIIKNNFDLHCDVLKVGHHGSSSSTSKEFLEKASPAYAVISCGLYNEYGHPHKETLDSLKEKGVKVYRTDLQKNIIFTSDGKTITKD